MKRTMATICALALMSAGLVAAQSSPKSSSASTPPTAHKKSARKAKAASKPAEPVVAQLPAQETPPVPATLMNKPPVKPSVTLEGGMLTIDAPNSTLNDVLNGVRKATGATIEGPNPTERVVVKLGPGEPGQVLAALLRGTLYDYVILGAPGKPDALTRVMLTQQSSRGSSASAGASEPPPQSGGGGGGVGSPRMLSPRQPMGDPDAADRNPPEENAPEAEEEQPQPAAEQQQPQPQPASDPNAPKTPEQLFKELQQLNQQKPAPNQQQQPPQ